MRAPEFWQGDGGIWPLLLAPLAHAYGAAGAARHALTEPVKASVPVICVGNLVTGGAGYGPPKGRGFTLESRRRLAKRLGRAPTEAELRAMHAENLTKLMLWDRSKLDDWAIDMQFRNIDRTRCSFPVTWLSPVKLIQVVVKLAIHDALRSSKESLCTAIRTTQTIRSTGIGINMSLNQPK
ncbi:MAG: tetraacyldisaccharide 4'-kinase [Proteobacteria bacterium]|nr:tetraacyldisaccharide 4'-kinase [Pseudomonadota bacterium]